MASFAHMLQIISILYLCYKCTQMYSSSFMCVNEPQNAWLASHCEALWEYILCETYTSTLLPKSPRWSFLKCFQIFMGLWGTYKDHSLSRKQTNVIWRKKIFFWLPSCTNKLAQIYWYYLHVDKSKNGGMWGLQFCSGIYHNPNLVLESYICFAVL